MSQQFQSSSWRGKNGERLWLASLVVAMEQAAQPGPNADGESRALARLRAQLALPAPPRFSSPYSLRN